MKKLLIMSMLLSVIFISSCTSKPIGGAQSNTTDAPEEITLPPFSDIGKDRIDFSKVEYTRPDTSALASELYALEQEISAGEIEYDALIEKIWAVDEKYSNFDTMTAVLMLKTSSDITDEHLAEEYEYLTGESPKISRALEELFVALARSSFAKRLEEEVFGEGFINEYKDGSKYTDYNVSLLERESELEAKYLALSPATVKINFDGKTDSYENILKSLKSKYKEGSTKYKFAASQCENLYLAELDRESEQIYIELLKVRCLVAESYGYSSYSDYAYEIMGHDYTKEEMKNLIDDIADFAVPVYSSLTARAFTGYFRTHKTPSADKGRVINKVYTAFSRLDTDIADAYSYMLNCGLYDIDVASDKRRAGAFTIYLQNHATPFIFATTEGTASDYMTVAHEFGHFYDSIKNEGMCDSLDLCEVYSQSLELLALTELQDILKSEEYKYLYYQTMQSTLETLIFQAFYARFEAYAYELSYDEINKNTLDKLVKKAAADMGLNTAYINSLRSVIIIHLIDAPFYVQSYCTSLTTALDIYFSEVEEEGRGIGIFKNLIQREDNSGFKDTLKSAAVPLPFREKAIIDLLDKIYYSILGSHYFETEPIGENAA